MPAPKDPEKLKEYLRKQSEARKGKPGPNKGRKFSEEHKAKLAAAKLGKPGPWLGKHRDEETKTKISENLKGIKPSPERYARQLEGIQRHTENITSEQREKMGWRRGMTWSDEVKQKISESHMGMSLPEHVKQLLLSPEMKAKRAEGSRAYYDSLSDDEKERRMQNFHNTSIECAAQQWLNDMQVVYEQQRYIGRYRVDFLIPADNLIIEVNGCFWHGCEECGFDKKIHRERRTRDVKRLAYLESKGYTVGIVWEHDLRPYMDEA